MRIVFQDPTHNSGYLLEELLLAAKDATSGGAIFAWVTAEGASAFLDDPSAADLLSNGEFLLIVGVDLVTNGKAVDFLIAKQAKFAGLRVKAVLHEGKELFHPKVAWFSTADQLRIISGSGNLTVAGLRSNWEVFVVQDYVGTPTDAPVEILTSWIEENENILVPIEDPTVKQAVSRNSGVEPRSTRRSVSIKNDQGKSSDAEDVLIAEIPKSGDRWSQANFSRAIYEGFFGARIGTQKRVILFHVNDNGSIGELESRPSVEVVSQNYRFELSAGKGIEYPEGKRPIALFRRVSAGVFLYSLEMPDSRFYSQVVEFLTRQPVPVGSQMRRFVKSKTELMQSVPNHPLWGAELPNL